MGSRRLPGKMMLDLGGRPVLARLIERVRRIRGLDVIVLATTVNAEDDCLAELARSMGIEVFRGDETDVMGRVLAAAQQFQMDVVVELMGDCPLIDPKSVECVLSAFKNASVDYASAALSGTYPKGTEAQVFFTAALQDAASRTQEPNDREHVTLYIYRHPERYRVLAVEAPAEHHAPDLAFTLDETADYALIQHLFDELYPRNEEFGLTDVIGLLRTRPDVRQLNAEVARTRIPQ